MVAIVLVVLMVLDVWYRAHTFGPDIRAATGIEPLAADRRRRASPWTATRRPTPTWDIASSAGDVLYRDLTEIQAAAGLLDLHDGRRHRRVQRAGDPAHGDPVRAGDDRRGLVDRPAAGRPGRGLPGGRSVRPAEHRPVPVRQRVEHGALHQPVRDALPRDVDPGAGTGTTGGGSSRRAFASARRPWSSRSRWPTRSSSSRRCSCGPGPATRGPATRRAGSPRRPGIRPGRVGHRGDRGDDRRRPRRGPAAYEDIVLQARALATDTLPEPNAPSPAIRWLTGNADPKGELPWPFGSTDYLVWWATGSWPLWLVSVPALVYLAFGAGSDARRRLAAGWTLAAWLQVVLPGLYWQHYYLLPIPGVAIAVAVALADAIAALASRRHRGVRRRASPSADPWRPSRRSC